MLTIEQDLCNAALHFSSNVLRTGGHFVCKFYQGIEDKELESQLKALFQKVHRLKPESSRSVSHCPHYSVRSHGLTIYQESKESFFVGLDRKP